MKSWKLFLAVILAGFLGLAVEALRLDEPCFRGRSITQWLDSQPNLSQRNPFLHNSMGGLSFLPDAEVEHALKVIGTNAIPTLIRMVNARDSSFRLRVNALLDRQTMIRFRLRPACETRAIGCRGFKFLGENGRSAAPALALLTRDRDAGIRYTAQQSLQWLKPERGMIVPVLLQACRDSAPEIRFVAAVDLHFRSPQELHNAGMADPLEELFKLATNNIQAFAPGTEQPVPR
jgi:hypothetical protein